MKQGNTFHITYIENIPVIQLLGEVTPKSLEKINNLLRVLLEKQRNKIVIDFEAVDHINYKSIKSLLDQTEYLRRFSGDLKCAKMNDYNWEIVRFVGGDQILKNYNSIQEAVLSFDCGKEKTWH